MNSPPFPSSFVSFARLCLASRGAPARTSRRPRESTRRHGRRARESEGSAHHERVLGVQSRGRRARRRCETVHGLHHLRGSRAHRIALRRDRVEFRHAHDGGDRKRRAQRAKRRGRSRGVWTRDERENGKGVVGTARRRRSGRERCATDAHCGEGKSE